VTVRLSPRPLRRPRTASGAAVALGSIAVATLLIGGAVYLLVGIVREHARTAYADMVPDDSFAVMSLQPADVAPLRCRAEADAKPATGMLIQPLTMIMGELSSPDLILMRMFTPS